MYTLYIYIYNYKYKRKFCDDLYFAWLQKLRAMPLERHDLRVKISS